jgi:hypothetical protein
LLPSLILAVLFWSTGPGPAAADYAQYLAHARALAEGRAYTDTGYIFTPTYPYAGPAAQPPGLPVMLWVLFGLFGHSLVAAKLVLLGFALAFFVLAGRYFARHDHPLIGLGVALMVSVAEGIARATTVIQSDLPFCAMLWAVVVAYDRPGRLTLGRLSLITALGAAAGLFRTFGVALGPAVLLYTLLRWRDHGPRAALPVLVWGAGFLAVNALLPITSGFSPSTRWITSLPRNVFGNSFQYRYGPLDALLYPFPVGVLNDLYHVAGLVLMVIGLVVWVRAGWRSFAFAFAVSYVALLAVAPVADVRYQWPMFPFVAFGLLKGFAFVASWLRRSEAPRFGARLAAATATGLALLAAARASAQPRYTPLAQRAEVRELFGALRRMAEERPARVAFVRPQVLALETRIPSMTTFPAPPERVMRELDTRCITHVVLGDGGLAPKADRAFRTAVEVNRPSFVLEFENSHFAVYRYVGLECRRDPTRLRDPR